MPASAFTSLMKTERANTAKMSKEVGGGDERRGGRKREKGGLTRKREGMKRGN